MKKKKFGDKIYIKWFDALEKTGWKTVDSALADDSEAFCETNGFYVGENSSFIIICHTKGKSANNDILGVLWIPKKWILKLR